MIDCYQKYPGRAGFTVNGLNSAFPLPPDRRFFNRLFDRQYHRGLDAHLSVAAMAWPWLSLEGMLIFRAALRRARIRWTHVLRCVVLFVVTALSLLNDQFFWLVI